MHEPTHKVGLLANSGIVENSNFWKLLLERIKEQVLCCLNEGCYSDDPVQQ